MWRRVCAKALGLAVSCFCLAIEPHAETLPNGTYRYDIFHETYGKIGSHTVRFTREGEDLVVSTRMRVEVKQLFMTLYRFESDGREVWNDGRLVELHTATNDNGVETSVKGWAEPDRFVIEWRGGRSEVMGPVYTTHAWNRALVESPFLLDATNGDLLAVDFADGGEGSLGSSPARTYLVAGEMHGRLWYGPDGAWLGMDFVKDGSLLSIRLASAPPNGFTAARRLATPHP